MKRFSVICICLALNGGTSAAGQKVFEGDEAAALRCANMIALTGIALGGAELISVPEKDVMIALSFLILELHVTGTRSQKLAALEVMQARRSPEATLKDYRDNAQRCLKRFPIN